MVTEGRRTSNPVESDPHEPGDIAIEPSATSAGPPWYGLDAATVRGLELHEARAHAQSGRRLVDLGDSVLLHDPADSSLFLNRLSALRLPDSPAAFDRRLGELIALFATLDRRPHLWLGPGAAVPEDFAARLHAEGFREAGAVFWMIHLGGDRAPGAAGPGGQGEPRIVRVGERSGAERWALLEEAATVLLEAFGVEDFGSLHLARELDPDEHSDVYVVYAGDEPAAAGRRFTADGATYLSSIGSRPAWRGRGFGSAVTRTMVADARSIAPGGLVHLAVEVGNVPAQSMYRHVGFGQLGGPAAEYLLT